MRVLRYILLFFIVAVAIAKAEMYLPTPTVYPADPCDEEADVKILKKAIDGPRKYRSTPTVYPVDPFDREADVKILKKAIDDTNVTAIIDVLTKRGIVQRLNIAEFYEMHYGAVLIDKLKGALTGDLENLIVALMTSLPDYYAEELHEAIQGLGTGEKAIIEILCTLSNVSIRMIKNVYERKHNKSLESDLKGDTSGDFRSLLVSLSQGNRNKTTKVDYKLAASDALRLYNAGVKKWGTNESEFISILVNRSFQNLHQTFVDYKKLSNHDIEDAIKAEFSGDMEMGLLALVKCIKSMDDFFAEKLYASMHGIGTSDRTLIRIIVTRSEIDLGNIKEAFQKRYGDSLEDWIVDDTSDDYKYALLSIVST